MTDLESERENNTPDFYSKKIIINGTPTQVNENQKEKVIKKTLQKVSQ